MNNFRGGVVKRLVPLLIRGVLSCAMLVLVVLSSRDALRAGDIPAAESVRLGERMYRDGILPSGESMQAFIRGDVSVDSTAFSCSSCHMRAGLGSFEGGVATPPTNGRSLYRPYRRPPSLDDIADRAGRYVYAKTIPGRPAYTREGLATALRFGTDPAGQSFNHIMPRYPLADSDMEILVSYLENLSSDHSPGATDKSISFATIVTDDVSPADRSALLAPLERFVAAQNQQVRMYKDFINFGYTPTSDMKYAFRGASLAVWELKGPPETWTAQLQACYDKAPVFAVLGGISNSDWRPIHEFCENHRLPCLFPITDFPVVSAAGWYTFYFNKGYYQEGEGAALYMNRQEGLLPDARILQIVQDSPAGKALASGFDQAWEGLGRSPAETVLLGKDRLLDQAGLLKLLAEKQPVVLLLWADGELVPALPAIMPRLGQTVPVFVSSTFMGRMTAAIAESVRPRVFITYPYRLTPYVGPKESIVAKVPTLATARKFGDSRISTRISGVLQQSVLQGLKQLNDNLYRDHLLDVMSMQMDLAVLDYERLSFGPGQRYASKGCYILQLGPGAEPALLPKSDWVLH